MSKRKSIKVLIIMSGVALAAVGVVVKFWGKITHVFKGIRNR